MALWIIPVLAMKAANEWWKNRPARPRPVTGFTYRMLPVPGTTEDHFRLKNPNAVPAFDLYRDLVVDPNWRAAAEDLLAKARDMADANPTCSIYVTDIVAKRD